VKGTWVWAKKRRVSFPRIHQYQTGIVRAGAIRKKIKASGLSNGNVSKEERRSGSSGREIRDGVHQNNRRGPLKTRVLNGKKKKTKKRGKKRET